MRAADANGRRFENLVDVPPPPGLCEARENLVGQFPILPTAGHHLSVKQRQNVLCCTRPFQRGSRAPRGFDERAAGHLSRRGARVGRGEGEVADGGPVPAPELNGRHAAQAAAAEEHVPERGAVPGIEKMIVRLAA
jgi:hypothetical protein